MDVCNDVIIDVISVELMEGIVEDGPVAAMGVEAAVVGGGTAVVGGKNGVTS